MKTLLPFLLTFLSLAQEGLAQQKEKAQTWTWQMADIIYLNDSTGVGRLIYKENKSGLGFINEESPVEKEITFPGNIFNIGKWKGNILVFYSNDWDDNRIKEKEIHVILVDARTKATLSDNLVFKNTGGNRLFYSIGKDDGGNFSYLLLRSSGLPEDHGIHNLNGREEKKLYETTHLTALFLSDKLEPMLRPLSSSALEGVYLSSYTNRKGEIAIISESNDQLIAEKFGLDGQLQKKLTTPLEFPENIFWFESFKQVGRFDPGSDNSLVFSIANKDRKANHSMLSLFVFDFAGGKVQTNGTSTLDKDFFKQMKDNLELTRTKHFKDVDDMKPDGIIYVGDKLAVCNQIQYTENNHNLSEGAVVSIYDRQLKLLHQFFLDAKYDCLINVGRGFSYHIRDKKLLLFGNELDGIGAYDNFYYALDLEKYTMEKKNVEWGAVLKGYPVDVRDVFWFPKNIVKNHYAGNYFFGMHYDTYLVKANY